MNPEENTPLGEHWINGVEDRIRQVKNGEDLSLLDKIMISILSPVAVPLLVLSVWNLLSRKDLTDLQKLSIELHEVRGTKLGVVDKLLEWKLRA